MCNREGYSTYSSAGCGGGEGGFSGFSAFFALLRVVPECSASFRSWGALDDEEFFVIEGSGVALTPGVELPGVRPPVVHELVASLALFRILHVWTDTCVNVISRTTTTIIQSGEAPFSQARSLHPTLGS